MAGKGFGAHSMLGNYMASPSIWRGRLIRLRAVEPEDWQHFHAWDDDTEFSRYDFHIGFPWSSEQSRKWAAELATAEPKNHEYRWVIETLDREFAGTLNSHTCDACAGTFRYGVAIRREHWRKGYASEAVLLVLEFFFRELRYQKVNVEVYEFNTASLALHRKLGFREEGRLRRVVYTGGRYYDQYVLGMTIEEFEASFGPGPGRHALGS